MRNKVNLNYMVDAMVVDFNHAPVENQKKFMETPREQLHLYHHGLGTQIRNRFQLWEHKWEPMLENGVDMSPDHPDAMSMRVIEMLWDKLNKECAEINQSLIKRKMDELLEQRKPVDAFINKLQMSCAHPNVVKTPRADTGNYSKSDDRY